MPEYVLDYHADLQMLELILKGSWDIAFARGYQQALITYVKGKTVKTVLILQSEAVFTDDCMQVFVENNHIPELQSAAVAQVVTPEMCTILQQQINQMSPEIAGSVPKPFDNQEDALAYLSDIQF